jgi:fumarylacetoacetate (FAA) hydrolase
MKLATLKNGTRDGALLVVNRQGSHAVHASNVAPNLQTALEAWSEVEGDLQSLYAAINAGTAEGAFEIDFDQLLSPLPRAYQWIDGSAYLNHIELVRRARGAEMPESFLTDPLVYQGGSDRFLAPREDIAHSSTSFGIDFEAELAVITDDVPYQTTTENASDHVKLLMLVNDVSLRALIPPELAKGFGFFVSKPPTAFSPFAVTPDELGDSWQEGKVHLDMEVHYNGEWYGNPNAGPEMQFSFHQLVQHVTRTRPLRAGAIIGSGTISNKDRSRGSCCLAEKRMIEKIEQGEFITPFMQFGDTVHIDMKKDGESIFGSIEQKVIEGTVALDNNG